MEPAWAARVLFLDIRRNGLVQSFNVTSNYTHPVDIATTADLQRHLGEMGVPSEEIARIADSFLTLSLKIEDVDARAAALLKDRVDELGGGAAMVKSVRGADTRAADLFIFGSRNALARLARGLTEGPFGLGAVGAEILRCLSEGNRVISWGGRTLDFTKKTYVMGILNCTPDSFYPSSRAATMDAAMEACASMIGAGVDIIDVGGESTRPGSDPVSPKEEEGRVVPVVKELRKQSGVMISVDTRRKEVAERAIDAGADMVNDVSGLSHDKEMAALVSGRGVPVVLMHMRGTPKTMQEDPRYQDTMGEILRELAASVSIALEAGISRRMIIVDPGIGFAKRASDNLRIIRDLASLKSLGFPILIGVSRKSFIGQIVGRPVEERLTGTIAANTLAVINGADIVRVHDVQDAVDMVKIMDSINRVGA